MTRSTSHFELQGRQRHLTRGLGTQNSPCFPLAWEAKILRKTPMKLQTLSSDALAKRAGAQREFGENERPGASRGAPRCVNYLHLPFPRNPTHSAGRAVPASERQHLSRKDSSFRKKT